MSCSSRSASRATTRCLLRQLGDLAQATSNAIINLPSDIARIVRNQAAHLLDAVPGALVPATVPVARQVLTNVARGDLALSPLLPGGRFPVILRPSIRRVARISTGSTMRTALRRTSPAFPATRFSSLASSTTVPQTARSGSFRVVLLDGRALRRPHGHIRALDDPLRQRPTCTRAPPSAARKGASSRRSIDEFAVKHAATPRRDRRPGRARLRFDRLRGDCPTGRSSSSRSTTPASSTRSTIRRCFLTSDRRCARCLPRSARCSRRARVARPCPLAPGR